MFYMSSYIMLRSVLRCSVISFYDIMYCHVLSCYVILCFALSCYVIRTAPNTHDPMWSPYEILLVLDFSCRVCVCVVLEHPFEQP